jgi:hypothetical protein
VKGGDLMERFGYTEHDCPPLYSETCDDYRNWLDEEGNDCGDYEDERWCLEFGDIIGTDSITAEEACCVCGGRRRG